MTSINSSPIQDAELEANAVSVTKWFWIGFLFGLIGVMIVYLRSPKVSVGLSAKYEEGERSMFERGYTETLKNTHPARTVNVAISSGVIGAFGALSKATAIAA